MQKIFRFVLVISVAVILSPITANSAARKTVSLSSKAKSSTQIGSQITGRVLGNENRPVEKIRVQLSDAGGSLLRSVITDSSGSFTFRGLGDGNYIVEVLPIGTDYLEPTPRRLSIQNFGSGQGGGQILQADFILISKDAAAAGGFQQTVPEPARKAYTEGTQFLTDKKTAEGIESLKKAVELFPTYFMALSRLGEEYIQQKNYTEAVPVLKKAVEVNPKGEQAFNSLGTAQLRLKQTADAISTFQQEIKVAPKSANAHLGLGMALYADGKMEDAEKEFKQAYKLGGKRIPIVHLHLAQLYDKSKRYKDEASELELYVKEEPSDPNADKYKKIIENLRAKAQ